MASHLSILPRGSLDSSQFSEKRSGTGVLVIIYLLALSCLQGPWRYCTCCERSRTHPEGAAFRTGSKLGALWSSDSTHGGRDPPEASPCSRFAGAWFPAPGDRAAFAGMQVRGVKHCSGQDSRQLQPSTQCGLPDLCSNTGPRNREGGVCFFCLQLMETFSVLSIWEGVL